jgi:hypothetical protein
MPEIVFALPVLPGKEALDRQVMEQLDGSRREQYETAMRKAGYRRHAVWHEDTPQGTLAIVYIDAESEAGVAEFASSQEPFNRWFREQMLEVHGVDISGPPPPVRKVHDHSV